MYEIIYIESIPWQLEDNVGLGGWANPRIEESAGSNPNETDPFQLDPNDDDMARLQEIAPDDYMDYRRPEREPGTMTRTRGFPEPNYREIDYYQMLREEEASYPGYVYPDRYGWEQYASLNRAFY